MKSRSFNGYRPGYHWSGSSLLLLLFYWCVQLWAAEPLAGAFSGDLPPWPKPTASDLPAKAPALRTQDLEVVQSPQQFGRFVVRVAGKNFAVGQNHAMVGYAKDGGLHWFDLATAPGQKFKARAGGGSLAVDYECDDPDGAHWNFSQLFSTRGSSGAIEVRVEAAVDQPRNVVFLPMLMVFPGAGSFGASKGQGLFAGLE